MNRRIDMPYYNSRIRVLLDCTSYYLPELTRQEISIAWLINARRTALFHLCGLQCGSASKTRAGSRQRSILVHAPHLQNADAQAL